MFQDINSQLRQSAMTPWYACLAFLTFPLPACLFELGSRVLEEDPLCQWNTNMRDVKLMDDCEGQPHTQRPCRLDR